MDSITSRLSQSSRELQMPKSRTFVWSWFICFSWSSLWCPVSQPAWSLSGVLTLIALCCPSHAWGTGIFGEADSLWVCSTVLTVILILTTSSHYLSQGVSLLTLSSSSKACSPYATFLGTKRIFFSAFIVLTNATSTINFWLFFFPGKKQSRQGARSRLLAWCAEKG